MTRSGGWGGRVDDFERNFQDELEPEQDTDRGAERLLQQTRFLAAAFRGYEARMRDEDRVRRARASRAAPLRARSARPLRRVVVTVADRLAEPDGLWPADFDVLTRLPGLERLDLVCTEAVLAAGYLERLHGRIARSRRGALAAPGAHAADSHRSRRPGWSGATRALVHAIAIAKRSLRPWHGGSRLNGSVVRRAAASHGARRAASAAVSLSRARRVRRCRDSLRDA